jgi:uncharacterized protein (DUF1499 family)
MPGAALMRRNAFRRRQSLGARLARLAALASVLMAGGAAGAFRFGLLDATAFLLMYRNAILVALAALALAAYGLWRLWREGAKVGADVLAAVLAAFVTLAPALVFAGMAATQPRLIDVSTDLRDPPRFPVGAQLETGPRFMVPLPPEEAARLQAAAYPDLAPLPVAAEGAAAEAMLKAAAAELGWITGPRSGNADQAGDALYSFEARSAVLGFTDDVVVRLRRLDEGRTLIDVRSASRAGDHDLGANGARIRAFLDAFVAEFRKRNG